jgi:DNA-binding transcriptional ArsR family regulator
VRGSAAWSEELASRRTALLELRSELESLTLCELSDRLDLADPVVRKELAALGAAPLRLACQQLRKRPPARLYRTIEDDIGGGQVPGADLSLELRAGAPDLVRPLQRNQPIRLSSDRSS